jgi:eukaryotic-like serine/threonine-protein kinase
VESLDTLIHPVRDHVAPPATDSLVLGRYRLCEQLGAGGFGVVWRAHDELLHREVAVKRISLPVDGDSERASREALAAARLSHPAIVALYEACAAPDAFYLISELVHGQTLAQLIAADVLADEEVLKIGIALAAALAHAHARGVIHRDIKPQNVLVSDPVGAVERDEASMSAAKLTDFGGARLAGEDALTRTGDVLGTLAYMAPEQSDGEEAGEEADLYSLALVLYEALSGVNPVRGATPAATVRRIGRPIALLEHSRRDLPRALTRSLDRALAPELADRGTLEELRLGLEEALEAPSRRFRRPARDGRARMGEGEVRTEPQGRLALEQAAGSLGAFPKTRLARGPQAVDLRAGSPRRADLYESFPQADDVAEEEESSEIDRGPALPRALWLACAFAAIVWQAWVGKSGVALLLLAAAVPIVVIPAQRPSRRVGVGWLGCAFAPVLGLAALAGAFPALAGQAALARSRAALGALGYWWLMLAEPLFTRRLWLGLPPGTPSRAVWESSVSATATHVLAPVLSVAVLLGAALWAGAAVVLPWIVRGRRMAFDVVGATVWAAALAGATPALVSGVSAQALHPSPRGALLGAIVGGILALAARALRGPV